MYVGLQETHNHWRINQGEEKDSTRGCKTHWAAYSLLRYWLLLTGALFIILPSSLVCIPVTMNLPAGPKLWFSGIFHPLQYLLSLSLPLPLPSPCPFVAVRGISQSSLPPGSYAVTPLHHYLFSTTSTGHTCHEHCPLADWLQCPCLAVWFSPTNVSSVLCKR